MERAATIQQADFMRSDDWTLGGVALGFLCILVVTGMIAILIQRLKEQAKSEPGDNSVARPVLAVLLVGTLVILAMASLTLGDEQTRNILIGGVVSLSSSVVAFYFSSKAATEARQDLLKATTGAPVPDLVGMTLADAQMLIGKTGFILDVGLETHQDKTIKEQNPAAGTTAMAGSKIRVTFTNGSTPGNGGDGSRPRDGDHPERPDRGGRPRGRQQATGNDEEPTGDHGRGADRRDKKGGPEADNEQGRAGHANPATGGDAAAGTARRAAAEPSKRTGSTSREGERE